jgi:hypothetical protein
MAKLPKIVPDGKKQLHRAWTFFNVAQMRRFEAAQKKKGLGGSALLRMIFNEWADREGL